jgi:hypothetical protein
MMSYANSRPRTPASARSAVAGCCVPSDIIALAVRWYPRLALSYLRLALSSRDVEGLLAERGVGRPCHRLPLAS